MSQVKTYRTVCSTKDYARAFIRAWRGLYDGSPTQDQCGVLYAQWIVETSGVHCYCWNIGNVKVTQAQVDAGVSWFDLPGTWEIISGVRVVLPEGHPGRRFRAYGSLDVAMAEHVLFLRNKRYAPSWRFVEAGDPDGFARALKRQGYYTAAADDYARIMRAAHAGFAKSSAFEDAMAEVLDASERETEPELEVGPIIHRLDFVPHPGELPPDDEPPDAA